jgi:hypothetical protein
VVQFGKGECRERLSGSYASSDPLRAISKVMLTRHLCYRGGMVYTADLKSVAFGLASSSLAGSTCNDVGCVCLIDPISLGCNGECLNYGE